MMEVEGWIESRIRYVTHVTSITHESVNGVMHVLQAVVGAASSIGVACV